MPKSPRRLRPCGPEIDAWHYATRRARHSRKLKIALLAVGVGLAAAGAFAATNWTVGLTGGSAGEAQSQPVSNLTISAVATPAATNLLFPGDNGDVVATINNPNGVAVTVTGVNLPTNATYASGYSNSTLAAAQTGCSSATSDVIWNYSTISSGSTHTLTTPLIVGAHATLTVTLTNDASMTGSAPSACEGTYFSMPSLTTVAATAGPGTAASSPTTDAWTS